MSYNFIKCLNFTLSTIIKLPALVPAKCLYISTLIVRKKSKSLEHTTYNLRYL